MNSRAKSQAIIGLGTGEESETVGDVHIRIIGMSDPGVAVGVGAVAYLANLGADPTPEILHRWDHELCGISQWTCRKESKTTKQSQSKPWTHRGDSALMAQRFI